MTRRDIVVKAAEATGVTKRDTEMMLDAILGVLSDALVSGERIAIHGFGIFHIGEVAEHTAFNALAGGEMSFKAQRRVHFKPAKELREKLNA